MFGWFKSRRAPSPTNADEAKADRVLSLLARAIAEVRTGSPSPTTQRYSRSHTWYIERIVGRYLVRTVQGGAVR
jgi:hypothetical protein